MTDLFEWQVPSKDRLVGVLQQRDVALDLSQTGTGKTYVALAVARALGLVPHIIAPKAALTTWHRVAVAMGVQCGTITNVEQVKRGKTSMAYPISKKNFRWDLAKGSLVIVDEAHRFGGEKTANSILLAQTRQYGVKVLALSATLSDKGPLGLRAIGYLCGLHQFVSRDYYQWCLRNGCIRNLWNGIEFLKGDKRLAHLERIRQALTPFSVRITVDSVPGFPENCIIPELVDIDEKDREAVNALYAQLPDEVKTPGHGVIGLVRDLRARQLSEITKVPILADMVEDALEEGRSAAVFLCFLHSITALREELRKRGIESREVSGQVKDDDRVTAVDDFQADKVRVICNQIDSGGLSISLHHTETSKYPRTAFICPNYSATSFTQALGRCPRTGGKSKVIQKIILLAGTIEEKIYKAIQRKLTNIDTISDHDLAGITS